jgi:hypothetical protein
VNCRAVKSKHPLFGQSLEPWHGWVGRCCTTRESRTEDVAAVCGAFGFKEKTIRGLFDGKGKGHLRWQLQGHFEGKDPLMARAKALRRQKPLEGKGLMKINAKAFRSQRPSVGKV